ncbi:sulfurtransferase [bacterium endosymbiont of Escarpia laminata]|nr:MAG: sulfurtransferase [bacterium endosymbiont of Escarpia laminata]RLJ19931.1 MAG: sulfurtransferase [bacterium endosymbiont of Escarpia laminata]
MKYAKALIRLALVGGIALSGAAMADHGNNITSTLHSVDVMHNGKTVTIERSSDKNATVPKAYNKIARHCPPFCIQPMPLGQGIETLGELEVLGYLKRVANGDRTVMVIDSRTPEWMARGTIPGSTNIPWNKINVDVEGSFAIDAEAETLQGILQDTFGARLVKGSWDFRNAKTLAFFCNGAWCPQSAVNVKTLVRLGYPAYKLKWYRGGMQSWVGLGLTTVNH